MNECMHEEMNKLSERAEAPLSGKTAARRQDSEKKGGPSLGLPWASMRRAQLQWEALCPWEKVVHPSTQLQDDLQVHPEMFCVSSGKV